MAFCPRCRTMKRAAWNEVAPPRCSSPLSPRFANKGEKSTGKKWVPCADIPEKRRWRMIPVRFVVACEEGHLDDFPWEQWAHSRPGESLGQAYVCKTPLLRFNYTGKAAWGSNLAPAFSTPNSGDLEVGMAVVGQQIPPGTTIVSFTGTTITLSANVTGVAAGSVRSSRSSCFCRRSTRSKSKPTTRQNTWT